MSATSIVLNGYSLTYERIGSGSPVFFFPGRGHGLRRWDPIIPALADSYTCFAFEPRGHGRSARGRVSEYSERSVCEDVLAFVQRTATEPAVLVGHSLGGVAATVVAGQCPGLVRAVYTEDVVPLNAIRDEVPPELLAFLTAAGGVMAEREAEKLTPLDFADRLMRAAPLLRGQPAIVNWFARASEGTDPAWYAFDDSTVVPYSLDDVAEIERAIRCPVHVALGVPELGSIVTDAGLKRLESAGVRLSTSRFPGVGHDVAGVTPDALAADIRAFLDGLAA